ncbi:MAG: hypothetical protein QM709_01680 [Spongiibacteraceae bacterium]
MALWFNSHKSTSTERIGLSLYAGGFAACVVDSAANKIVSTHFQAISNESGLADSLLQWARDHNLKGRICYVSLGPDDYKLVSTESPAVPEAEINQALLWGLRDVIDSKPEDTAIDSFPSATGIHRSGKTIRQAVTARKARIRLIVDAVLGAGLELGAIEIPELSQRNVIKQLEEDAIGVGLVSQNSRGVSVAMYRGGELYVTRQLAGISSLADAGHPLTAPRLIEQLGLELLRTLDYYDSQLRQRPPAAIFLQPLQTETRPLLDGLSATINLPARQLQFASIVKGAENLSSETFERCFIALGAALRRDDVAQQINLYTEEFHPRREWLSLQRGVQLCGGTLAAGLLITAALAWHNRALNHDASELQAQLQTEQNALNTAQTELAARVPSPELTQQLQRRQAEEAAKTELLAALKTGILSGSAGYAPILTSLGQNTIDGLWLNQIEIVSGDVNLAGNARKPDLIPIYIDKIVSATDFGPRGYESLAVKANENGLLEFALRGHRSTNPATTVR